MTQNINPGDRADPEADGIPSYADDDSFADPAVDARRYPDDPDATALPGRDPIAVTDFGTTAEEQHQGESLDGRLAREVPDVTDAEPEPDDDDIASPDLPPPPVDPRSPISGYEELDDGSDDEVGRLVEPDEGAHTDREPDAVADARGPIVGASPEETALHLEPER